MVHDEREQPPPETPDEIAKLGKYKFSSDANPRDVFWAIVKAYVEKEHFAETVKANEDKRVALVNVSSTALTEEPRVPRVKITKGKMAECILAMVLEGEWKDVLERVFDNLYNRKKGPNLNMLVALGNAYSKEPKRVGEWMKELLLSGRPPEATLAYVSQLGDEKLVKELRDQLLNISKTEINEPQLYALEALSILVGKDKEVEKLFLDMMDDWDARAKKVVLEHLTGREDPDVGKKALSIYPYEFDPYAKSVLREIVDRNREGLKEEVVKLLNRLGEREAKELVNLVLSVYSGEEAMEMSRELVSERTRSELLTHVK